MLVKTLLFLTIPALCSGFFWRRRDHSNWNGLKVSFGINPFTSFNSLPRTRSDAIEYGWVNMAPSVGCNGNANFKGERYWKDGDLATILIFGPEGYIAGLQAGIPKNYPGNVNGYPSAELQNKPFVLDGDNYYITSYFVNPASLCTGRTEADFRTNGTGTGLWIQNGTNPVTSSVRMPASESDADRSMWIRGKCLWGMGQHYWYNLKKDMSCNDFYPVFLMYNDGVLNSFGWAFGMNLKDDYSGRIEHPPQSAYGTFMTTVPDCLASMGTLSTLHIYLTNSVTSNRC